MVQINSQTLRNIMRIERFLTTVFNDNFPNASQLKNDTIKSNKQNFPCKSIFN